MKTAKLLAATAFAAASGLTVSTAQAEDLTLCWAAWGPANALVELSKEFEAEYGHKMKFEFVPWPNFADRMLNELNSGGQLCDLLIGLLEPGAGAIAMDGTPFDAGARARLRPVLAYVTQQGLMPGGTVREGLTGGREIAEADLWQALATVGAETLIRAQTDGLDTALQPDSTHFSGGERQRLQLAAALLRKPKLLVLDEATNALDVDAEDAVLRAVFDAAAGATVVMVSHRAGTQALADHVIRLDPPGDR